jgi:hypothetical protein
MSAHVVDEDVAKSLYQKYCEFASRQVGTENPPLFAVLCSAAGTAIDYFIW